jgi:prepilin signal peptidase PulO-like enzyme (type II secretory pathway)
MIIDSALLPFLLALTVVIGLCVGSFLNVVALRFLSEESITLPPSHCTQCQALIRPYDNIPVLSYLLLHGKCRACKAPISIQYPLVELATGLLFGFTFWHFGLHWPTLVLWFFIANLMVIFVTDWREKLIFEINSLPLIPIGLIFTGFSNGIYGILGHAPVAPIAWHVGGFSFAIPEALVSALLAIVIVFAFFEGMILLSRIAFGTDGFGHGDTHLMMGAGAFLGMPLTLLALFLGFIAQSIPAIPMLIVGWIRNKQYASLISGGIALGGSALPLLILNLSPDFPIPPVMRGILCIVGLLAAIVGLVIFLRQVRQHENYTYLPLGPALIVGILVALFWGKDILDGYFAFIHR